MGICSRSSDTGIVLFRRGMMRLSRLVLLGGLAALLLAASGSATTFRSAGASRSAAATASAFPSTALAPAFTAADLAAVPGANWITNGGNISNDRYSSLNQINTGNVASLKEAWHINLDGSGKAAKYSAEGTPVVYNGIMYIPTGNSDVFAVNAATGARVWTYLSGMNQTVSTACCGWDNRGVAIGDGKVYVAQLDGHLVALDQATGQV